MNVKRDTISCHVEICFVETNLGNLRVTRRSRVVYDLVKALGRQILHVVHSSFKFLW